MSLTHLLTSFQPGWFFNMVSLFRVSLVLLLTASSIYIVSMASAVPTAAINAVIAVVEPDQNESKEAHLHVDEYLNNHVNAVQVAQASPQNFINVSSQQVQEPIERGIDLSGFPACDSPACRSIAVNEAWPDAPQKNMMPVNFRGFNLSLPKSAIKTRENNSFCQFDFTDKRWITMTIFERSDMDEFFKASNYIMSDWANIVFMQTPDSQKPTTENEAYAWYASLMNKVAFVGGNMVVHYKKMPIEVYTINEFYTGKIIFMIVSRDLPNVLLQMEVYGFEPDAIKQLVAGVEK